nr:helix-turn-helix domain-containing protein [uncultured Cetobacterium sp.]
MREMTCPLEVIFHILKGKWIPIILWRARIGNQRIADFKKDVIGCNEKMLIQHINSLIEYELLEKTEYDVYPKHTEYNLTEFGWKLIPFLAQGQKLGIEYLQKSELLTKKE